MKAKAVVLERFNEPLVGREFEVQPLAEGEVLVKILAAGVCGSDVHMWRGKDPRTPLPMILGHEGIGRIADTQGEKFDVFGRKLEPGDKVVWERGIMCGKCYYCVIKKQPALCPHRQTYGISLGCTDPPHFVGCYGEYLHLRAGAHMIKLPEEADAAVLVPATCSGATAAHAVEQAGIQGGDSVLIVGPGPVGIFCLVFALCAGASKVFVMGTGADAERLKLCEDFGATATINTGDLDADQRRQFLMDATHGLGVNVGLDCTGAVAALSEGLSYVAPYGTYLIPGIATPVGEVPIPVFERLARKNVRLQGVWVSDTSHLHQAIELVQSGRFPFERLITHRFPLESATEGLMVMEKRQAIKAVLEPGSSA